MFTVTFSISVLVIYLLSFISSSLADRYVNGICPNTNCRYPDARGDECEQCQKLVNAIELTNPRCRTCKNTPQIRESEHLFLDLPKVKTKLLCFHKKR